MFAGGAGAKLHRAELMTQTSSRKVIASPPPEEEVKTVIFSKNTYNSGRYFVVVKPLSLLISIGIPDLL